MLDSLTWWMWGIIALDLAVAAAAICVMRYGAGLLFGVDTKDELAEKDNFAFGIALAGGMAAVAVILAGVVSGEASVEWSAELGTVVLYAFVGLVASQDRNPDQRRDHLSPVFHPGRGRREERRRRHGASGQSACPRRLDQRGHRLGGRR